MKKSNFKLNLTAKMFIGFKFLVVRTIVIAMCSCVKRRTVDDPCTSEYARQPFDNPQWINPFKRQSQGCINFFQFVWIYPTLIEMFTVQKKRWLGEIIEFVCYHRCKWVNSVPSQHLVLSLTSTIISTLTHRSTDFHQNCLSKQRQE